MFRFKQFTINDEHCAMKVGTDSVLLGAWATAGAQPMHWLDMGCGSGLLSLMLAQRAPKSHVTGVEIDTAAAADAQANAKASPFAERVEIVCADVLNYARTHPHAFDAICTNPPYHEESLLPPSSARAAARHTAGGGLTFSALLEAAKLLLKDGTPGPCLSLVLPSSASAHFQALAAAYGFVPYRLTEVVTRPQKPCKRVLLEFTRSESAAPFVQRSTLVLLATDGARSEAYEALCKDFYLSRNQF